MTQWDISGLEAALGAEVDGEVRFDAGSRGAYATDGSNYRQVPLGVVVPRTVEAGARAVAVCARFDVPVLSRGGGTSLAGQTTNTAQTDSVPPSGTGNLFEPADRERADDHGAHGSFDESSHARSWQEALIRHPAATALGTGAAVLGAVSAIRHLSSGRA